MLNRVGALILLSVVAASAQERFVPPDQELWGAMVRALHDLPMSMPAHQGVDQILQQIQREAQGRALRARLPSAPPPPKDGPQESP